MSDTVFDAAPALFTPATHRFLSPHYDDIALSCGGTVALLAGAGLAPEISVAFGAEPDPNRPLSDFAAGMHRQWGLAAAEVIARRRHEEATAAGLLGATSRGMSFADAIYRDRQYQSDAELFGAVAAAESTLSHDLTVELLAGIGDGAGVRWYAPLGIGNHVDHQICFATGLTLAAAGHDVWFYEDLPYALRPHARDQRLDQVAAAWRTAVPPAIRDASLEPAARVDISAVWDTKLAAILTYPSQVPVIFRNVAPDGAPVAIARALRDYAMGAGDGFPAEQFWRVRGTGGDAKNS